MKPHSDERFDPAGESYDFEKNGYDYEGGDAVEVKKGDVVLFHGYTLHPESGAMTGIAASMGMMGISSAAVGSTEHVIHMCSAGATEAVTSLEAAGTVLAGIGVIFTRTKVLLNKNNHQRLTLLLYGDILSCHAGGNNGAALKQVAKKILMAVVADLKQDIHAHFTNKYKERK